MKRTGNYKFRPLVNSKLPYVDGRQRSGKILYLHNTEQMKPALKLRLQGRLHNAGAFLLFVRPAWSRGKP